MSGALVLGTVDKPLSGKLSLGSEVLVFHGTPINLQRFIRVNINGVIGRLYFEEVTPDEDTAQITRHYEFETQKQIAQEAIVKAQRAKEKASAARATAAQMTQHNIAILAQLQTESDRRAVLQAQTGDLQRQLIAQQQQHDATMAQLQAVQNQELAARGADLAAFQAHQVGLQSTIDAQNANAAVLAQQLEAAKVQIAALQAQIAPAPVFAELPGIEVLPVPPLIPEDRVAQPPLSEDGQAVSTLLE